MVFVDLVDVLFDCFLDRNFNLIFLARVDVSLILYHGCLSGTSSEETEVAKLVGRKHLCLLRLLITDHWRQ